MSLPTESTAPQAEADIILLNFRRAGDNPILQAMAIRDAISEIIAADISEETAKRTIEEQIGRGRNFILQRLRLLSAHPDIQSLLKDGRMTISQVSLMVENELLGAEVQQFMADELNSLAQSRDGKLDSMKVHDVIARATKMAREKSAQSEQMPVIPPPEPTPPAQLQPQLLTIRTDPAEPQPKKKPGPKPRPPAKRYLEEKTQVSLNILSRDILQLSKDLIKRANLLRGFVNAYTNISNKDAFIIQIDEAIDAINAFFVVIGIGEEAAELARMPKKGINVNIQVKKMAQRIEELVNKLDPLIEGIGEEDILKIEFLKGKQGFTSNLQEVISVIRDLKEKLFSASAASASAV